MTRDTPNQRNEGEGNRTAARAYNKDTEAFAKSGKVKPAAKKAADALNSPEGADLKRAEAKAKSRAKGEDPALKKYPALKKK